MKKLILLRIEKTQVVKDLHTKVQQHIQKIKEQNAFKANKKTKTDGI